MTIETERALVRTILLNPLHYDWSYQGLGMLRLYLDDETRLHVWHSDRAVDDVSTLHTHPWDFESTVICGWVKNERFAKEPAALSRATHMRQPLCCGEGGGLVGSPEPVCLVPQPSELYGVGDTYSQRAYEIHQSNPCAGAVTIVRRSFHDDRDHADVFWQSGEWVSAEPRRATADEVRFFCGSALARWNIF